MPYVLRKIRKARWYDSAGWLSAGGSPADALGDLLTQDNALSVWIVDDAKSNLEQVVTALAANCDNIANVDYALFDESLLSKLSIKVATVPGDSPYDAANAFHRDLVELSATKVIGLVHAIQASNQRERVPEKDVASLLRAAFTSGGIDVARLKPSLKAKLATA